MCRACLARFFIFIPMYRVLNTNLASRKIPQYLVLHGMITYDLPFEPSAGRWKWTSGREKTTMIGRLCTLKDWHKIRQNLARRGIKILAIFVFASTLMGANPSSSVQAAPAYANYHFVMIAVPSAAYVCTGQTMTFKVGISVQLETQPGDTAPNFGHIRGGWVFADVESGDGKITPESNFFDSPEEIAPDSATFTFKAGENPGTTTLKFESFVSEFWYGTGNYMEEGEPQHVSTTSNIEVRKCRYSVEIIAQSTIAGLVNWVGTNDTTTMHAETDTHFTLLTGYQITEHWLFDTAEVGCNLTATAAPTEVDFSGDLVNESFYLTFTLQKATMNREGGGGKNCGFSFSADFPGSTATVKFPTQGGVMPFPGTPWFGLIILTRY